MAGFFYYLAMIAAGGVIYGAYAPLDIYISMFCHGSIYFCGFVTIGTELCSAKDAPKLALGVAWWPSAPPFFARSSSAATGF